MISLTASSALRTSHFLQTKVLNNPQLARPNAPRIFVRDQRGFDPLRGTDGTLMNKSIEKIIEKKVQPIKIREAKLMESGSKVLTPSQIIVVSKSELPTAETKNSFGTGMMNFPKAYDKDRYVTGQVKVQTKLPGEGPFTHVQKSKYDIRGLKYLYLINSDGVHIKREMAPCTSNRGIVSHPKLAPFGSRGGEVWFVPDEHAVHINLNSGRFPSKDQADLDAVAKVWLALGYDKVYVTPFGQRYGEITPILYTPDRS